MKTILPIVSSRNMFSKFWALIFVLLFIQATNAQLDSTFGTNGVTVTSVGGNDRPLNSFLLPDGKILVFNSESSTGPTTFQLVRYNANGTLDTTYGNGGIASLNFPSLQNAQFTKAWRQSDGKIVLTGGYMNDSVIAQVNENGTLDTSFAGVGYTIPNFNPNGADKIDGSIIQPDGKILVSSYFNAFGTILYFVRYLPDGNLDSTFGSGGIISHTISTQIGAPNVVEDIYLQSNGKILVKGNEVRRFNADGSADDTFPVVPISSTYDPMRTQMVVQPDDKFLVATRVYKTAPLERAEYDARIERYNANGGLDTSFGVGGRTDIDVTTYFRDEPIALAVQSDNQIIVGITTFVPANRGQIRDYRLSLARLSPSGVINGKFLLARGNGNYNGSINIQPDGKIIAVHNVYTLITNQSDILLTRSVGVPVVNYTFHGTAFDFNYDGIAEPSVFRPGAERWYFSPDAGNGWSFGAPDDILVPSDYLGDLAMDIAVFRPSNGYWYIAKNFLYASQQFVAVQWGQAGDIPVPADYDGDSKSDIAVFRPSNGGWYIRNSADNSITTVQFGASEDKPVPEDFDGDGKIDIAVWRPSNGTWYVRKSSGGFSGFQFGANGDIPVQSDYDGDGTTDIAVYRPSNRTWYWRISSDGSILGVVWGLENDRIVPADYDGDYRTDIAVYRPSQNLWYVRLSSIGASRTFQWGYSSDIQLPKR